MRYNSYVRSVKSTFLAAVELLNCLRQLQIAKEASVPIFHGSQYNSPPPVQQGSAKIVNNWLAAIEMQALQLKLTVLEMTK